MEQPGKDDQRALAVWAADCAERVLALFEEARPDDGRPGAAIAACRDWARTGAFSMKAIRKASLDAHAAARDAQENAVASAAARAAGQAVATAHVREHAFGPAYYALKAAAAHNPADPDAAMLEELRWQWARLPAHLRPEWRQWQAKRLPKALQTVWRTFTAETI
jgi:hypothetical protein